MEWVSTRLGTRGLGIAAILAAVLLLSLSDALVKASGESFGLAQLVFLRSAIAVVLIAVGIAGCGGGVAPSLRASRWVWLRSLCLAGMWVCYYAALPALSFALAAACYYTAPAWMAVLSRIFYRERIGLRGTAAILLSLCGVVLALDPAVEPVSMTIVLPLAAAFLYALAAVVTWGRCRAETTLILALNLNVTLVLVGGLGLLAMLLSGPADAQHFVWAGWRNPAPGKWQLLILLGVMMAVIATTVALAYRLAPSPVVGVFDTAYLLFAAIWSALLFSDFPAASQIWGMALIAAAAVLMARGHPQSQPRRLK